MTLQLCNEVSVDLGGTFTPLNTPMLPNMLIKRMQFKISSPTNHKFVRNQIIHTRAFKFTTDYRKTATALVGHIKSKILYAWPTYTYSIISSNFTVFHNLAVIYYFFAANFPYGTLKDLTISRQICISTYIRWNVEFPYLRQYSLLNGCNSLLFVAVVFFLLCIHKFSFIFSALLVNLWQQTASSWAHIIPLAHAHWLDDVGRDLPLFRRLSVVSCFFLTAKHMG